MTSLRPAGITLALFVARTAVDPLGAQVGTGPAFEVASVKPNQSGVIRVNTMRGGRYTATVTTLMLIRQAYQVERSQIFGAPNWLTSELFDIAAKAPDGTPAERMPLMLQWLLVERFRLVVHRETRTEQTFALVTARKDGQLGPQMRPAAACGGGIDCRPSVGVGSIVARDVSMAEVATLLQPVAGRPVLDRTGLVGRYDISLQWTPTDSNGPSFVTVIQEQLGLKLELEKGPGEFIIVDHVERPTPN